MPKPPSASEYPGQILKSTAHSAVGQKRFTNGLEDKREFERLPFRGHAKAVVFPPPSSPPEAASQDSEVMTSDLSRGGVSILNRSELTVGQKLLLLLNERNQLVEVRWCCQVWDGLYAAGCRFLSDPETVDVDNQLTAIDVVISEEFWWNPAKSG